MTLQTYLLAKAKRIANSRHQTVSFSDFMQAALYHPTNGYYNQPHFQLGARGDFTTASELSPLYAACFAKPAIATFHALNARNILEIGAGSGQFACHLMRTLQTKAALPDHYYIYDVSMTLRRAQQQFLQAHCPLFYHHFIWLDQLPDDYSGFVIANEVLDAMPVHCFEVGKEAIFERRVIVDTPFTWDIAPAEGLLRAYGESLQQQYDLPVGYIAEINIGLTHFFHQLTTACKEAVIIFADYGYGQREYYHPSRQGGTLTCYYQHTQNHDPFLHVGKQDITAFVDFTRVAEAAVAARWSLLGYTSQAAFLLDCGLVELMQEKEANLSELDRCEMNQALKILTLPTEMGERCKMMAFAKGADLLLPGFQLQDKIRELG